MTLAVENISSLAEALLPLHLFEGLFSQYRRPYTALPYYVTLILAAYMMPVLWLRIAVMAAISLVGNYITYRTKLLHHGALLPDLGAVQCPVRGGSHLGGVRAGHLILRLRQDGVSCLYKAPDALSGADGAADFQT